MKTRLGEAIERIDEFMAQVAVRRGSGAGGSEDRRRAQRDAESLAAIQRINRKAPKTSRLAKLAARIGPRGMASLRRRFAESSDVEEISNGARVLGLQLAKRKGGRMYTVDPRVADAVGRIELVLAKAGMAESVDAPLDERFKSASQIRKLDRARLRRKRKRYKVKASTRRRIRAAARRSRAKRRAVQRKKSTQRKRKRSRKRYSRYARIRVGKRRRRR